MLIEEIAAGDMVRLRTGSPKMTVTDVGLAGVAPFQDTPWPKGEPVVATFFWHDNHGFVSSDLPVSYVVKAKLRFDEADSHG